MHRKVITSRSLDAKHRFTMRREALGEVVDVECSNKKIQCHTAKHRNRATKDAPCSCRLGTSLQMGDCIPCHPRPMNKGNNLSTSMNKGHAENNQKRMQGMNQQNGANLGSNIWNQRTFTSPLTQSSTFKKVMTPRAPLQPNPVKFGISPR
jgi:hypothetical protein